MNQNPFPHTRMDQQLGGILQCHQIDAIRFADHNARGAFDFKFIQEAIIHMGQRGQHNLV